MYLALVISSIILLIGIYPVTCEEVAYIFDDQGGYALENVTVSPYNGLDKVNYSTGGPGSPSLRTNGTTVDKIKNDINKRIIVGNPVVKGKADELAMAYPGPFNIGQVCSIYAYLRSNWSYINDPWGEDYYKYPNETLQLRSIGGDCDDFSILMSSLIDAIGGTSRIVLAYGPDGGHAYTEVYLGKMNSKDRNVEEVINWLKMRYNLKKVSTHKNLSSNDVWLNLDWSANYPGGPFDPAPKQVPILLRVQCEGMATPNPLPMALFSYYPSGEPNAGEPVTFNATKCTEIDDIKQYYWEFGDGVTVTSSDASFDHIYSKGGPFEVNLTVTDVRGINSSRFSKKIKINYPPIANFTYLPSEPKAGDTIQFDASPSEDRDGQIVNYEWKLNDSIFEGHNLYSILQSFPNNGNFTINLTVTDNNGAKGNKSYFIIIGRSPTALIYYPVNDDIVDIQESVNGVAKDIPDDQQIWLVVHVRSTNLFYPQGSPRPDVSGNWSLSSTFGDESQTGERFDAILLLAGPNAQSKFRQYFNDSKIMGWSGMNRLPEDIKECHKITVIRK